MTRPDWLPDWLAWPQWASDAWSYAVTVWNTGVFDMTYGQIFSIIGIILISLIIRGIFARTIVRAISRAAAGTKTNLDDALVVSISEPLKMVPVIIGVFIAMSMVELDPPVRAIGDKLVQALVAMSIFWALSRAAGAFSFLLGSFQQTLGWMVRTLQVLFLLMGVAAALQIFDIPILPVLGGLGVFGVALAFGAQDLVKNLIAGVFILVEKRFQPGDWIKVEGGVEGVVESIGFRSITVRQFDKSPVYVPNAVFSDNAVTNYSRMTYRRIRWTIGVEYRTTIEQLKYIRDEIEAYLVHNDDFVNPPDAGLMVHVDSFNDSSIDYLVYCFTRSTKWDEWLMIKEKLAYKVMEIVHAAGTDFAFPSRTLYVQKQDAPEIFAPPKPSPQAARISETTTAMKNPDIAGGRDEDS